MRQLFDEKLAIAELAHFASRLVAVLLQRSAFGKGTLLVDTVAAVTVAAELAVLDLFVLFKDKSLAAVALLGLYLVLAGLCQGKNRVSLVEWHLEVLAYLHRLKVRLD